jgi:hypothetical protein
MIVENKCYSCSFKQLGINSSYYCTFQSRKGRKICKSNGLNKSTKPKWCPMPYEEK